MQTMKMKDVPTAIMSLLEVGESPCLIGGSGIGKTELVTQVADALDMELVPVYLITKDPVELGGFPVVDGDSVKWVPPAMFLESERRKLYFFDEITHAATMVQSVAYQIFNERRVGEHLLPAGSACIGAHNRVSDRGVHNRVPVPLRRRWWEFHIEPDTDSWIAWGVRNDVHPLVLAFIRYRPELLYTEVIGEDLACDPRAWTKISKWLTANPNLSPDVQHSMLSGKVGEGAAVEFSGYIRLYQSLPPIDEIFKNPKSTRVPGEPASCYAVSAAISRYLTVQTISAGVTYLSRMSPEYGVAAMRDAFIRDTKLQSTPSATKWARENADVIL